MSESLRSTLLLRPPDAVHVMPSTCCLASLDLDGHLPR